MRNWIAAAVTAVAVTFGAVGATSAEALPVAPPPVAPVSGIAAPCAPNHPFPAKASMGVVKKQLEKNFGFTVQGTGWTESNRRPIRIVWETLDALNCTTYLEDLQKKVKGKVGLNATSISGYAWGDWSLTRNGSLSLDFTKFKKAIADGDEGRLSRIVTHELAHVLNKDRSENPGYWKRFERLYAKEGRFSAYGGTSITENWADVVGYYVGRCALNNPYDTGKFDAYYEFVRTEVFAGKEFGPEPGTKADCTPPTPAPSAQAGAGDGSWLEGLAGA